MHLLFAADDLAQFAALRRAFDPSGRLNPRKVLPLGKGCGEARPRPGTPGMRGLAGLAVASGPEGGEAPWWI
jgi:hypothetical protein